MLLCEKFQSRFGAPAANGSSLILLNEAAIELSVPRRRLYDIINVLEAVEVQPDLLQSKLLHCPAIHIPCASPHLLPIIPDLLAVGGVPK